MLSREKAGSFQIDEVTLVNSSPVADELIERRLTIQPVEPLDFEHLEDDLINLYKLLTHDWRKIMTMTNHTRNTNGWLIGTVAIVFALAVRC